MLKALLIAALGGAAARLERGTATFHGNAAFNGDPYTLQDGSCACWKASAYRHCSAPRCFDGVSWPYLTGALNTPGMENTAECGACYRVTCVPGRLRGRKDSELGPWDGCLQPMASVTVMVTDSCPCAHWNPSNARHCCGPHRHIDLSYWAFARIGRLEQGVIDVDMEKVDCGKWEWTGVSDRECTT